MARGRSRRWLLAAGGGVLAMAAAYLLWPTPVAPYSIERLPPYHDATLLRQAWALPVARRYQSGFVYQSNPSSCGPTSIANLLRSEGTAATPAGVLAGTGIRSYFGLLPGGLTLDQEADLLRRRTGQTVTVRRGLSLADFRREVARSNDPALRIIVNFTRAPLFGRGHGHFSPVLGYLPARDLVFVGDVNGGYRPWLTPVARLYAAQDTVDPATRARRGVLEVRAPG